MPPLLPLLDATDIQAPINYTKNISKVAKQYKNDYKNDRLSSFNAKLDIFFDICKCNNVLAKLYIRAFSIMLKGLVLD